MNIRIFAFILLYIFISIPLRVEAQKFGGGIKLGFNASQIDGDDLAGYDKIGINTGLNTSYNLSKPWQLNLDFVYSQRGSQSKLINDGLGSFRKITLNYLELPIYVGYQDWYMEDDFYKVQAFAGASYSRLFSVKNQLGVSDIDEANFLKNDISYLFGVKYMFTKHFGIEGRYTRSITKLYKNPNDNRKSLIGYFLNFGLFYKIL